jgi:hypothetical protein
MKTSTSSLDKKIEELCEAIPSGILKYFYLLCALAGTFVSVGIIAGIVFAFSSSRFGRPKPLSVLSALAFIIFVVWATREMFRAFKDARPTSEPTTPS